MAFKTIRSIFSRDPRRVAREDDAAVDSERVPSGSYSYTGRDSGDGEDSSEQVGQRSDVRIEDLYVVFSDSDGKGLEMARQGARKDEIQNLTGAVVALAGVSLEVSEGELFVVMGSSGCGKSTLIRCINRLVEPSLGKIWVGDCEVTALNRSGLRDARLHRFSMIFQDYGLMPHRSVLDNVAWGLKLGGMGKAERMEKARDVISVVGLEQWASAMPTELSGGMRQRVGIARALAMDTSVLLLDEPFSALEPARRRALEDELMELQERAKKTMVLITHSMEEAVRIGDRIAMIDDGRVVQVDDPASIVLSPKNEYVQGFAEDIRRIDIITAEAIMKMPEVVVRRSRLASETLELLVDAEVGHACLVDDDDRYVATVALEYVQEALESRDVSVDRVPMIRDQTLAPNARVDEMVRKAVDSSHSLVVIDGSGVLLGEVVLDTLSDAMSVGDRI